MATAHHRVAAISFHDNHSLSVDVEGVEAVEMGPAIRMDDTGHWFVELIVRSRCGTVALQLVAEDPENLAVIPPDSPL